MLNSEDALRPFETSRTGHPKTRHIPEDLNAIQL